MKISFVIPAHNEEALIADNLRSVLERVAAGDHDAEIIVVDNASTDRTGAIARSFPGVSVVDEPRKGLTRARQAGFQIARGHLIANIDADTMIPAGWIETVLAEFGSNSALVALSGPFIYYDLSPTQRSLVTAFYGAGYALHRFNHDVLGAGAMLQGGNFVVRRDALERIGGFDTAIEFWGEDTDIARRIGALGTVKWTFKLPILASGRRLKKEGVLRSGWRYALNHLSTTYWKRPATRKYTDIRHPSE